MEETKKYYYRPTGIEVLVKISIIREIEGAGGKKIELSEQAWKMEVEATVIACGNQVKDLKPGQRVLLNSMQPPSTWKLFKMDVAQVPEYSIRGVLEEYEGEFDFQKYVEDHITQNDKPKITIETV